MIAADGAIITKRDVEIDPAASWKQELLIAFDSRLLPGGAANIPNEKAFALKGNLSDWELVHGWNFAEPTSFRRA